MAKALEAVRKISNRTKDVCQLEGFTCQNIALIHKQNDANEESLKMSEEALKADPTNWKALTNRADLSSKLA